MNKLTASYLAGIIDGEGYIGILRVKPGAKKEWRSLRDCQYVPVIKVAMIDKAFISWLKESFGGTFETRKAHGKARESYCWAIRKGQVKEFIRCIYPYLKIKRKQGEIILRFPKSNVGRPIPDNVFKLREKLYLELISLH